jgi:DNA-nicking Smr family endonuclease
LYDIELDGFQYTKTSNELIKVFEDDHIEFEDLISTEKLLQKDVNPLKKERRGAIRRNPAGTVEIDLHFHELVEDETGFKRSDKLNYQLEFCRKEIERHRERGEKKLIIIHGIGEGILRREVRLMLDHMVGLTYHDASFKRYGRGATTVEF